MRPLQLVILLPTCALLAADVRAREAPVPSAPAPPDYIRYLPSSDGDGPDRLQTAVTRFRRGGVLVDLVGVAHLADAGYFEQLNERLAAYDLVLYEMMGGPYETREERMARAGPDRPDSADGSNGNREEKPPAFGATGTASPGDQASGRSAPTGELSPDSPLSALSGGNANPLAALGDLQAMAKKILGLEFQLDAIDYGAPNFVHADLDWEQFEELADGQQEDFASLLARAMELLESGALPGLPSGEAALEQLLQTMLLAVTTGNSAELKRTVAPVLGEAEGFIAELEAEGGTIVIGERNRHVVEQLEKALAGDGVGVAGGRSAPPRSVAIFYGAGHMPDLEERLLARGFAKEDSGWLDAWTIEDSAPGAEGESPASLLPGLLFENPELFKLIQEAGKVLQGSGAGP